MVIPVCGPIFRFTGPGSFFKAHQDTPRGRNMFGSLVVVFPTAHEGGELVLRPRDAKEDAVLDFGAWLREESNTTIAYDVFFSDVTHEVYEVNRGSSWVRTLPSSHSP